MKVSVIIPTYCRAELVCSAIDSVISQNVANTEIVVIDDGSTDDTVERLESYGDKIVFETGENKGLSAARNRGIEMSTGEYIALLDSDDWWMPGKLKQQCEILDRNPEFAGVYSNFTIYRGEDEEIRNGIATWFEPPIDWSRYFERSSTLGGVLGDQDGPDAHVPVHIGSLYSASLEQYFVLPSTALFRRSHLPARTWFPPHDPICGDWEFFARLSREAPLCFVDLDTTYNRSHNDEVRLTKTRMLRQMTLRIDFLKRIYLADRDFYDRNRSRVDQVWTDRLAELCKLQMLDGNRVAARTSANEIRQIGGKLDGTGRILLALTSVPGASGLMRLARKIKRRL